MAKGSAYYEALEVKPLGPHGPVTERRLRYKTVRMVNLIIRREGKGLDQGLTEQVGVGVGTALPFSVCLIGARGYFDLALTFPGSVGRTGAPKKAGSRGLRPNGNRISVLSVRTPKSCDGWAIRGPSSKH
jgi:hypothetical protein